MQELTLIYYQQVDLTSQNTPLSFDLVWLDLPLDLIVKSVSLLCNVETDPNSQTMIQLTIGNDDDDNLYLTEDHVLTDLITYIAGTGSAEANLYLIPDDVITFFIPPMSLNGVQNWFVQTQDVEYFLSGKKGTSFRGVLTRADGAASWDATADIIEFYVILEVYVP